MLLTDIFAVKAAFESGCLAFCMWAAMAMAAVALLFVTGAVRELMNRWTRMGRFDKWLAILSVAFITLTGATKGWNPVYEDTADDDIELIGVYTATSNDVITTTYQGVDYLKSTGSQRIETDIDAGTLRSYTIDFQIDGWSSSTKDVYGSYDSSALANNFLQITGNNTFFLGYGGSGKTHEYQLSTVGTRYTFDVDYDSMTVTVTGGDAERTFSIDALGGSLPSGNQFLFDIAGDNFPMNGRIYSVTVYNGKKKSSGIYRHLVPVLDSGVCKMLDTVTGATFSNSGTGSFTYGSQTETVTYVTTNLIPMVRVMWTGSGVTTNTPVSYRYSDTNTWTAVEKLNVSTGSEGTTNWMDFATDVDYHNFRYWHVGVDTPAVVIVSIGINITSFVADSHGVTISWNTSDPRATTFKVWKKLATDSDWTQCGEEVTTTTARVNGFYLDKEWHWRVTSDFLEDGE